MPAKFELITVLIGRVGNRETRRRGEYRTDVGEDRGNSQIGGFVRDVGGRQKSRCLNILVHRVAITSRYFLFA